jgi:hypothetical protein
MEKAALPRDSTGLAGRGEADTQASAADIHSSQAFRFLIRTLLHRYQVQI